jgi:N-acetylglucosamine kinase-like BadF-type ATPase
MTGSLFLGVDGGGTKTDFVLIDREGRVAAQHRETGAYHLQIGMDGLREIMGRGLKAIIAKHSISAEAIEHAFFGLPAYGEDNSVQPLLDAMPAEFLGHRRYCCGNDMISTWAGSLGGDDGIGIVACTGSIGYGERAGRSARAGGWGEQFSDEGSAYWIATRGLNAFSRMADGRMPRGPLHAILAQEFRLTADLELCAYLTAGEGPTRDRIASFCPLVAQAADQGDEQALAIFEDAGRELAAIAGSIRTALGYVTDEPVPLSYSGGVFETGDRVLAPFRHSLLKQSADFDLRKPLLPPGAGAALYAARISGRPLDASAIARLRSQFASVTQMQPERT